jgi:hypothetical protein
MIFLVNIIILNYLVLISVYFKNQLTIIKITMFNKNV